MDEDSSIGPKAEIMVSDAEDRGKPDLGPIDAPVNDLLQPLVDHCMSLFDEYSKSKYRASKIEEISESRRVYEQIEKAKKKKLPWKDSSNMVLPLYAITVDNLEPRLTSGLVGRDPVLRFEPEGVSDKDDDIKLLETWFDKELTNVVKVENLVTDVVHTGLLEGVYFGFPKYVHRKKKVRDFQFDANGNLVMNPETESPITIEKEETSEGGEIERVPFTDVFAPDDVGTEQEWEEADICVKYRPTYAELMREKQSSDTTFMADKLGPWLVGQKTKRIKSDDDKTPDDDVMSIEVTGKEVIQCINFYISYPINRLDDEPEEDQTDFTEERILVTVARDTQTIIRLIPIIEIDMQNGQPLKRVRMFAEPGRTYGTSMYGKLKSIQNGASDFFNTVLDISLLCMIPWFFYDETSGLASAVELHPGKGVPVESVGGVMIPDFFKLNPSNYLQFIEIFMRLWEMMGNISNPQIGRPDDKQKTATEIMSVIQEGNIKYDYQAKTTKSEFIRLLVAEYNQYYQYMPYNKTIMINGEPQLIPRAIMKNKIKFCLTGSTASANKMIERKEAEDLDNLAQINPLINPIKTLENRLKSYDIHNPKEYINPQVRQMIEMFKANPELSQVVQKYVSGKMQLASKAGMDSSNSQGNTRAKGNMKKMNGAVNGQ